MLSRLAPRPSDRHISPAQREFVTQLARSSRGTGVLGTDGWPIGVFDALGRAPSLGQAVVNLGERLRFAPGLEAPVIETVIMAVTGHWRSAFSWGRHIELARRAGISDEVLAAIAENRDAPFTDAALAAVYNLVREVLSRQIVYDSTFDAVRAYFDEPQTVRLASLIGYYCLTSVLVNVFAIPAMPDDPPPGKIHHNEEHL